MPIDRTPGSRADANTSYFDAALRHQIGIRNLTTSQVNELLALLDKADKDIINKLRIRLQKFVGRPYNPKTKKFKDLLTEIKAIRAAALREVEKKFRNSVIDLSKLEVNFEKKMLEAALPVLVDFQTVPSELLTAIVTTAPFGDGSEGGRTIKQWFSSLRASDQTRFLSAIQVGMFQGESIDEIVGRVRGTKQFGFRDGVLGLTRRQIEAVVRTGVNGISNAAREAIWAANAELVSFLRWTSTLDGRTSAICRSRDGKFATLTDEPLPAGAKQLEPNGARPPAHVSCRSVMVAVFSKEGILSAIGQRPFVRSTQGIKKINFRDMAKRKIGADSWANLTEAERRLQISKVRNSWADKNIGTVPADVTYNDWLRRQPASFQDEVLGKTKGELFRTGKVSVDEFVTKAGNEVTLSQLAKTDPTVFIAAGLDPSEF